MKNALFIGLDKSAKEAERRVRRIRESTSNKPVGRQILQTKRTISQLGARVTSNLVIPNPPRSAGIVKSAGRRLTD